MKIIDSLFGSSPDPARPPLIERNQAQRIRLVEYRVPWWNYWTTNGGEGWMVIGGPKAHRRAEITVPILFPTRAIARSVAKYMTRSARLRVNGTLVR